MQETVTQKKVYKQPPEVREYFKKKATERRIKQRKCTVCGAPATVKTLDTKLKLCDKCNIEYLKEHLTKKEEQTKETA